MPTFGLVFVLFAPDAAALANLDRARAGCAETVVVDNTPEPDAGLHERLRAAGTTVLANRNAGGLAGAYNRGIEALLGRGVELCFMLDQDSEITDDFFVEMAAAAAGLDVPAYLIGPRIYEIAMDKYFPNWADDAAVTALADPVASTQVLISSGSAVSAAAYDALGPFREDLFIEWVDVEYSQRAGSRGVPLFVHTGETLRQHQGAITEHAGTFTTNHVALRRYYNVRNGIWTGCHYAGWRRTVPGALRLMLREANVVLRYEGNKLQKVLAVVVGGVDGFRGRLGPFEQVRPRVYRYCTR